MTNSSGLRIIYDRVSGQTTVDFRDLLLYCREFTDALSSDLDYTSPDETRQRVRDQQQGIRHLVASLTKVQEDALRRNGVVG